MFRSLLLSEALLKQRTLPATNAEERRCTDAKTTRNDEDAAVQSAIFLL
jgi:hypothetical protein